MIQKNAVLMRLKPFWLLVIVALAAILLWTRTRLNYNGPYLDESDYLFVGQRLLSGGKWPTHSYIFSSDLPLYILGAGADWHGLVGSRIVASVLGLVSLLFYWEAIRRWFKSTAIAAVATLILALSAPHAFISKFAVYDVVCFFWFSAGLWALVRAWQAKGWSQHGWAVVASLLMVTAVLSKYVVVLELAVLGLLVIRYRARLLPALLLPALSLLAWYGYHYREDLWGLYQRQIVSAHGSNTDPVVIFKLAMAYIWPVFILYFCARIQHRIRTRDSWRKLPLFGWAFWLAVPMVAYHYQTGDMISLYKHVVYPVAFLAPIAAIFIVHLARQRSMGASIMSGGLLLGLAALGVVQVKAMENAFPDGRPAVAALKASGIDSDSTILTEDPYLFRYMFAHQIKGNHIFEAGWFDNNGDGNHTSQDVVDAVWEGKFRYIYLDGRVTPVTTEKLRSGILQHKYELIYSKPYVTSTVMFYKPDGVVELYRSRELYSGKYPLQMTD